MFLKESETLADVDQRVPSWSAIDEALHDHISNLDGRASDKGSRR